MTLAYENGASTIDWACGVSEGTVAPWIAPVSDRQGKVRDSSLAALAGTSISSRFCSWIGLSGRRYIFSVYQAADCPAFRDAILLAVVRDIMGQRRVVSVWETGAFPEPVVAKAQRELSAYGPGVEFHLHLVTNSTGGTRRPSPIWRLPKPDLRAAASAYMTYMLCSYARRSGQNPQP